MGKENLGNKRNVAVVVFCAFAFCAGSAMADTVIYSDGFSGTGALNGTTVDVGGANWIANTAFQADGSVASAFSSALLAFAPEANKVYTLTVDVINDTSKWIGLGFSQAASSGSVRFTNPSIKGVSWMLYRNNTDDHSKDVGAYAGPRADNNLGYYNLAAESGFDFSVAHALKIVMDTAGDGTSYKSSFYIDDIAMFENQVIAQSLDSVNYVGMTRTSGGGYATVDNFSLTVIPEPATLGLIGMSAAALLAIRRLFAI